MKKNVASQRIGAQLVSATDGSAFTGAVTVYVTGDAGAQAIGSVSSGACAHEGNGYHTYAPTQAETNYDLVAFTFIGSGAVPATVQVFTSFPQTGDTFVRVGAPVGVSVSADVAAIKAETVTILADTNELQTDWVNGGRLDLILDARASQTSVDDLPTNAELAAAFGTADDAVLTAIEDLPTNAELATALASADDAVLAAIATVDTAVDAIKAKTDNLPAAPAAAGDIPSAAVIADAVLDEAVDGAVTLRQSIRLSNSALGAKASGLETTEATFRDLADTKDRIVATVDADGNRTVVVRDLS
jgi:hypothetical protein